MKSKAKCEYIDIHSHILFGVDDGSPDLNVSLQMVKTAYDEGIRHIVCTPHYHPRKCTVPYEELWNQFEIFCEAVSKIYKDMSFSLGRELFFSSSIVEALENGEILCMGNTNYVLVEYDPTVEFSRVRNSITSIMQSGYIPIIAHVERYMCLVDNWELIYETKDLGAVIQMNSDTVIGNQGSKIKKFVKHLLNEELVDVIGTDAHSNGHRAPKMTECANYLFKKYGDDYATRLLRENSITILNGEYID